MILTSVSVGLEGALIAGVLFTGATVAGGFEEGALSVGGWSGGRVEPSLRTLFAITKCRKVC